MVPFGQLCATCEAKWQVCTLVNPVFQLLFIDDGQGKRGENTDKSQTSYLH